MNKSRLKIAVLAAFAIVVVLTAFTAGRYVAANRYFMDAIEYQEHGDLSKAKAGYSKAISLNPWHDAAAYQLGSCLLKEQRIAEAASYMKKAANLNNGNAEYQLGLGFLYYNYKKNPKTAKSYFAASYKLNNKTYYAPYMLAKIAESEKKPAVAISFYEKTVKNNPDLVIAYSRLAMLYEADGRCSKAKWARNECNKRLCTNSAACTEPTSEKKECSETGACSTEKVQQKGK